MTPAQRRVGAWSDHRGISLHDALGESIARARQRGPAPALRWIPGTVITDGERIYEVVYGSQGLGRSAQGWVAAVRTEYLDDPEKAPERHAYSLWQWTGTARDGAIIIGGRRATILRMVRPAPRLAL